MEASINNLLENIQENYQSFSKGQKNIANFLIEHYEKAAFMTAAKLGSEVNVSESTVVRFAIELGFDGYPKLQKALRELIKIRLTASQRMDVSLDHLREEDILKSVFHAESERMKTTLQEIDNNIFNKVVEKMVNAKRIYIMGARSSAPLASTMAFYLNMIADIRLINTTSMSELFESLLKVSKDDVLIGMSFPRYSKRTIKVLQFVKSRGATTIAITDSQEAPLAKIADISLYARSGMLSFVDSLSAPLCLINALIVAMGMRQKDDVRNSLEQLEKIWEEYDVYEKKKKIDLHGNIKGY
jgi:DNA-binding MurR/RpiR family transcriptional regulator